MSTELDALRRARILVVGDLVVDEYASGVVRRISREAPVPIVEVRERTRRLGGAANVAQAVRAVDASASVVGVVGTDPAAVVLRQLMADAGVEGVLVPDEARRTTVKTRVVAKDQQICRIDEETSGPIAAGIAAEVLAAATKLIAEVDAVVVSDYGIGVLTPDVIVQVIAAARERGLPIVVDPCIGDLSRYAGATMIKPNQDELLTMAGMGPDDDVDRAARAVLQSVGEATLVVTRGADGISIFTGTDRVDIPAEKHLVYDVTGAGDTTAALLALGLVLGRDVVAAARLANFAGGLAVTKPGTTPVTLDELLPYLD